jgi:hypothetical protein
MANCDNKAALNKSMSLPSGTYVPAEGQFTEGTPASEAMGRI